MHFTTVSSFVFLTIVGQFIGDAFVMPNVNGFEALTAFKDPSSGLRFKRECFSAPGGVTCKFFY
jgi:hypothetical protein